MPIALMLLFVYVFGGNFGHIFSAGSVKYVDFIVPGIVAMTVVSGIAYAAVRLSMDMQRGMVNRFRTMPIAPSSILSGHAVSSLLSNLFSVLLVVLVGLLVGFRSHGFSPRVAAVRSTDSVVHLGHDMAGNHVRFARQDRGRRWRRSVTSCCFWSL